MKVSELIEQLSNLNPDAEVHFAYDYGDYGHTMIAPVVQSVNELCVEHNTYVNDYALVEQDYEFGEGENTELVVVIQA